MFRPVIRAASRRTASSCFSTPATSTSKRLASTAPPHQKSRSWRSSAARWALAGAVVYYYNTASVFAEETEYAIQPIPETTKETETYPTVASVSQERRKTQQPLPSQPPSAPADTASPSVTAVPDAEIKAPESAGALEEEAQQQEAFNEETGEINWDCPCLGGMAHGPCGEQFKSAFSCFVYSKEEPKGVDCIDNFKNMQNCFREHPDVYGSELDDDDDDETPTSEELDGQPGVVDAAPQPAAVSSANSSMPSQQHGEKVAHTNPQNSSSEDVVAGKTARAEAAAEQVSKDHDITSETDQMVPKAWHDTTNDNTSK